MHPRRVLAVAISLALVLVGLSAAPGTAVVRDLLLSVTYPTATKVNPDAAPYPITVNDRRGTGTLVAVFFGTRQVVPHSGTVDLTFGGIEGTGRISILRCVPSTAGGESCTDTGHDSPEVTVKRRLTVTDAFVSRWGPYSPNGDGIADDLDVGFRTSTQLPVAVSWTYLARDGSSPTVSGETTATPTADGFVGFTTSPVGLSSGDFRILITVETDDPDFGHLVGTAASDERPWFSVDVDPPPPPGHFTVDRATFYPYPDGYQDHVTVSFPAPYYWARLMIVDDRGQVVWSVSSPQWVDNHKVWLGLDRDGRPVAPGTYQARLSWADEVGNKATYDGPTITALPGRLVKHTVRKSFTPSKDAVDTHVGRCSSLARPSARGERGSLGLYSNTRCARGEQASLVSAVYRLRLPRVNVPSDNGYNRFWVTVRGGAARSRPRSLGIIQYADVDGWIPGTYLESFLGLHPGQKYWAASLRRRGAILFAVSAKAGNRYDVLSITAHLDYFMLE